jgi:hypothetical protein
MGGTFYADIGGARILSVDGSVDQSGSDDNPVVDWTKTTEFILDGCIWSGNKDTVSSTYKLQWNNNTDSPTPSWADLAATGELNYALTDSSWAHGATVATGDQVCDIQDGDARIAGERIKDQSLSDAVDLADEEQTELWFGINSDDAHDGDEYGFRLWSTAEGTAVGIYGVTITMASAGVDELSINEWAMAAPLIDQPAISQVHVLAANAIDGTGAAIDTPAISQIHVLSITEWLMAAPLLDTPEANVVDVLDINEWLMAGAVIDTPAISQIHNLSITEWLLTAGAIDNPALSQVHVLSITEWLMAAAILDSPELAEAGEITWHDYLRYHRNVITLMMGGE